VVDPSVVPSTCTVVPISVSEFALSVTTPSIEPVWPDKKVEKINNRSIVRLLGLLKFFIDLN
jgi:hypothetical protein